MATITSAATGLWSAGATWVGGVAPADNDAVVIATGHVVTFDADTSGFANGIAGITITGTLKLYRTAGTYHLKIKAATTITGAGTFDCGTLADPIPFAAKHTITGGNGWYITGTAGLTMTVYAAEPAIKRVALSGAESAGATVLEVGTDVTGDIWAVGDTVRIDDIDGTLDSEARVIAAAGIAAGSITITAGLTNAKIIGAYVSLITRNVRFVGVAGNILTTFASGKLTIAGGEFTAPSYSAIVSSTGVTISGGAFAGNNININNCTGLSVSGGTFSGNTYGVYNSAGPLITGGTFSGNTNGIHSCAGLSVSDGTFAGNTASIASCAGASVSGGTFSGNLYVISSCAGASVSGGTFSGNTRNFSTSSAIIRGVTFSTSVTADIVTSQILAYNCAFNSTTENSAYTSLAKEVYSESFDHDQVAGAYKAWTAGGVTITVATPVPTGYAKAYKLTLESATIEGYYQRDVTVGPGASVNIEMQLRKDASMAYLPRCQVFLKGGVDPFAAGTPLKTFTMTDSVDTYESDLYTYTNATAEDVTLVVRALGKNATGNVYIGLDVEQINVDLTTVLANLAIVDTVADAIKVKTDLLSLDGSGLVNITQTAADKVWASAARTLTSFGTLVADIWASATRTLTSVSGLNVTVAVSATTAAAVSTGSMAIQTYYTFEQAVTSTTTSNLSTATKLWLAIKDRAGDTDADSLIFVEETAGLTVVNKATYATIANGTLVVTGSSGAWTITAHIEEAVTSALPVGRYQAELKALCSGDTVAVWSGTCAISAGVVQAYS